MSNLLMFSFMVSFGILMVLLVDTDYTTLSASRCRAIRLTGLFIILLSFKYFLDLLADCQIIQFVQQ